MDIAALDLGSNSFHMLVARVSGDRLAKLGSRKYVLGLGAYVQRPGGIPAAVREQALCAVESMAAYARTFRHVRIVAVGTSALREASNGPELARAIQEHTGIPVDVVSGDVEAELVYAGARSALPGLPESVAVVDLGGGSLEIAAGREGSCRPVASLPLGFLRLGRARGVGGTLDLASARALAGPSLGGVAPRLRSLAPDAWVFSGGTARAFGEVARRVAGVDITRIRARVVLEVADFVVNASASTLAAHGVDPARLPTLGAGAAMLGAAVEALAIRTIAISAGGLREGIVLKESARLVEARRRQMDPGLAAANL